MSAACSFFLARRAFFPACLLILVLVCSPARLVAQGDASAEGSADSSDLSLPALLPGLHLLQKDSSGKVTYLRDIPARILKDAQSRFLNQERLELYDIQKLELKGTQSGDLVSLQAELLVNVEPAAEWVRVPIGFDNFYLTDLSHSTDAENGDGRFEKGQLPGKNWLLFGKGEHRLTLSMVGRVRLGASQRTRLKVSAPDATLSHMVLSCPQVIEAVEISTEKPFQLSVDEGAEKSEIETWGLQADTEISWLPRTSAKEQSVTIQPVDTALMKLDLTTGLMVVTQSLSIFGGSIAELEVGLPQDFVLSSVRVTDDAGRKMSVPTESVTSSQSVIRFSGGVTGSVKLEYNLNLKSAVYPQQIGIRMPDLVGVVNESADLEISSPVGLEVKVELPDENETRQKRVESPGSQRTAVVAYRLLSSTAEVRLTISETEAFYSINPLVTLETERSTILLTGRFPVNMVRGSLNEMQVDWPAFRKDGWTILDVQMLLPDVESKVPVARINSDDSFRVTFPGRQSGQFEIEIQAARDLASFQATDRLLFFPDIKAPAPHTTTVALIESDAFSMSLGARAGDVPYPSLPASRLPEDLRQRTSVPSAWLIDSVNESVELRITPQQPEVRAGVLVDLSIARDSVHVSQVISYDVLHRDLSELRLTVPDVTPTVRLENSNELLQGTITESGMMSYPLPESIRGRFRVLVDFYWLPEDSTEARPGAQINIPLVLPGVSDQLTGVTVATNEPSSLTVDGSSGWTRVHSDKFTAAWFAEPRQATVPVILQHALERQTAARPVFVVLKSVAHGEKLITSATAVFSEPIDAVLFSISNTCLNEGGYMEGYIGEEGVDQIETIITGEERSTIQLRGARATSASTTSATLVIEQKFRSDNGLYSICQPEVPRVIGQEDGCNAIWVIAENPETSLLHLGGSMTEITSGSTQNLFGMSDVDPVATVSALVAPYDPKTQAVILSLLNETLSSPGQYSLFAGTAKQSDRRLVSVPRRTILLLAVAVGLLLYFAVLRLRAASLLTSLVLITAAVTALLAVLPNPGVILLQRLAPGVVLAVFAACLQRILTTKQVGIPLRYDNADQSTIFTVDESLTDSRTPDSRAPESQLAQTAMMP